MGFIAERVQVIKSAVMTGRAAYSRKLAQIYHKYRIDDSLAMYIIGVYGYEEIYKQEKKRLQEKDKLENDEEAIK